MHENPAGAGFSAGFVWSGREDLNLRPLGPEPNERALTSPAKSRIARFRYEHGTNARALYRPAQPSMAVQIASCAGLEFGWPLEPCDIPILVELSTDGHERRRRSGSRIARAARS